MLWQISRAWFIAIASDVSFFFFFGFKIYMKSNCHNFYIWKTFGSFSFRIISFVFLFLSFGFGMFGSGLRVVWWSLKAARLHWAKPARLNLWTCDYFLIDLETRTLAWPQTLTLHVWRLEVHNINRLVMVFKYLLICLYWRHV